MSETTQNNLLESLTSVELARVDFNEFAIGASPNDIFILLRQNGKEEAILNASHITVKELVIALNKTIDDKETSSQNHLFEFCQRLKELLSIDEVIIFATNYFPDKHEYLWKRIRYLIEVFDGDEGDEISLDSLKSTLLFLLSQSQIKKPTLTLNENGTFQCQWKIESDNLMTLRFKNDESLDYAIFQPSQHTAKPIVLDGSMNLWDFKDYLKSLNILVISELLAQCVRSSYSVNDL